MVMRGGFRRPRHAVITGVALLGSVVWCRPLPRFSVSSGRGPGILVAGQVRVPLVVAWRGLALLT